MKTKRAIYYILVIAGACLLFASSAFSSREVGLAMGFILLMGGLYGLSRSAGSPEGDSVIDREDG